MPEPAIATAIHTLEECGIVVLEGLVTPEQLRAMQAAFAARLQRPRWNDVDGYERTERYRHMVHDVLALEQGFLDVALHPTVKAIARHYLGPGFALTEAKGWRSVPTRRDFHGWHGDAWYEQRGAARIHRELKLGLYLTDVRSGAFNYLRGTHGQHHPRTFSSQEVARYPASQIAEIRGAAGTAFLFDTTGIHRQGVPMLEPRQAVFYNFHDPAVPLQREDVEYYRYHPLQLNAAFLGGLDEEGRSILGFGDKTNYLPAFQRAPHHQRLQAAFGALHGVALALEELGERVVARLRRIARRRA
jgi:hypothetical protein